MWGEIKKAINSNLNKTLDVLIQERSTETNQKVDSKASQESIVSLDTKVQTGNNLIGATNNTGGTVSSGSIFAKLNKLLTDWTTARAGYLDTNVSSRQANWGATTTHRDRIDTAISSRASQASIDTLLNGRVVKSVQRGILSHNSNEVLYPIPLTSINPSKTLVILDGVAVITSSMSFYPIVHSITSDMLVINVLEINNSAYAYRMSWQVIEFY